MNLKNGDMRYSNRNLSFAPATLLPQGKSAYVFSHFVPETLSGQLLNKEIREIR